MAVKILAFVLTLLIDLAVGVVFFFGLILAMNGFNGSDAEPGILAFIVLTILASTAMAGLSAFGVYLFSKRGMKPVLAALISVPVSALIGGGLILVASIIGVSVAEYVRVHY